MSRCSFSVVSSCHAPVVGTSAQRCQKEWNVLLVFQMCNTTSVSVPNHRNGNKTSLGFSFFPPNPLEKNDKPDPSAYTARLSETAWEEQSPPFEAFLTP